jgi:hypothetical protein
MCPDEGYEPDGSNGCTDMRPPVIECLDKGCEYVHLWAIKGEGAIMDSACPRNNGVLFFDDEVSATWLETVLEKVAIESPALRAFDLIPGSASVDLTARIMREKIRESDHVGIWTLGYSVQDLNGNMASFEVRFNVTTLSAEILVPLLTAGPRATGHQTTFGVPDVRRTSALLDSTSLNAEVSRPSQSAGISSVREMQLAQ